MNDEKTTGEPSGASGGSATFTVEDVGLLYDEWKRLHCGPRQMVSLIRKPYWKKVLSVPWMWWTHFGTARQHATVFQSARLATLFAWAFLTFRKYYDGEQWQDDENFRDCEYWMPLPKPPACP